METMPQPKALMESVRYFSDAERTHQMAVALRWTEGVECPVCGSREVRYFVATQRNRKTGKETPRRLFECKAKHPKRQFTVKTGSIFEDSALPLEVWFTAIWAVANCKNGISSYELARATGITQKSAWFVLHRIRLAMDAGGVTGKFGGVVEADEAYIGGLSKNMHAKKRKERITKANASEKVAVMGLLQRGDGTMASRVHARVIRDANRKVLQAVVRERVEPGSILYTDSLLAYRGLSADYLHAKSITPWSTSAAMFIRTASGTSARC